MTKRDAKRLVIATIKSQLRSDIDNGSLWLEQDAEGEPLSEKDQARVLEMVMTYIDADTIIAKRDQP